MALDLLHDSLYLCLDAFVTSLCLVAGKTCYRSCSVHTLYYRRHLSDSKSAQDSLPLLDASTFLCAIHAHHALTGIRCGDGAGASGREAIPFLRDMGAVSEAEAMRRCPGLVIKDMRMERYRQVRRDDALSRLLEVL